MRALAGPRRRVGLSPKVVAIATPDPGHTPCAFGHSSLSQVFLSFALHAFQVFIPSFVILLSHDLLGYYLPRLACVSVSSFPVLSSSDGERGARCWRGFRSGYGCMRPSRAMVGFVPLRKSHGMACGVLVCIPTLVVLLLVVLVRMSNLALWQPGITWLALLARGLQWH